MMLNDAADKRLFVIDSQINSRSVLVTGLEVHVQTARFFVELANGLDCEPSPAVQLNGKTVIGLDPLMSVSLAAVLSSYSAVEAFLNEVYLCEEENFYMLFVSMDKDLAQKLDAKCKDLSRMGVRQKVDAAIELGGAVPLDWTGGVAHDLFLLGKLRNELIHHKARWIDDRLAGSQSTDDIEQLLYGRFPLARHPAYGNPPFRWSRCLGSGCARWAWTSARQFINEVASRLKVGLNTLHF